LRPTRIPSRANTHAPRVRPDLLDPLRQIVVVDRTPTSAERRPVATDEPVPDLVNRDFTAVGPHQLWVADITCVRTFAGVFCLAMVPDVFSGRIVGWMMADTLRAELVIAALEMAVHHRDRDLSRTVSVAMKKYPLVARLRYPLVAR
jgi:transposase InsO family protein